MAPARSTGGGRTRPSRARRASRTAARQRPAGPPAASASGGRPLPSSADITKYVAPPTIAPSAQSTPTVRLGPRRTGRARAPARQRHPGAGERQPGRALAVPQPEPDDHGAGAVYSISSATRPPCGRPRRSRRTGGRPATTLNADGTCRHVAAQQRPAAAQGARPNGATTRAAITDARDRRARGPAVVEQAAGERARQAERGRRRRGRKPAGPRASRVTPQALGHLTTDHDMSTILTVNVMCQGAFSPMTVRSAAVRPASRLVKAGDPTPRRVPPRSGQPGPASLAAVLLVVVLLPARRRGSRSRSTRRTSRTLRPALSPAPRCSAWIVATFGGGLGGIWPACDGCTSEHHEGRAFDWTLDATKVGTGAWRPAASPPLRADDERQHPRVDRRMGVMYLIWDDHIWSAWDASPRPTTAAPRARACAARSAPATATTSHLALCATGGSRSHDCPFYRLRGRKWPVVLP